MCGNDRFEMTENTLVNIVVNYIEFMTSKSLITKWINDVSGKNYTRQNIIKIIINFTRVINGVIESSIKYALSHAKSMHFDETHYRCIKITGSCYMWVAVSGKHEEEPFCIFFAAKGRSHEQFLEILGIKKNDDGEFESEFKNQLPLQNIVTDGYSAYSKGIKILVEFVHGVIYHGICIVHVRREFLAALDAFGVLNVYQKAVRTAQNEQFQNAFNKYLQEENINNLQPLVYKIVHLTYIIDLILGLDTDFICKNADDIKERRLEYTKPLLDQFFSIIDDIYNEYIEYFTEHHSKNEDGSEKTTYSSAASFRYIKAIVYVLNHREEIYAFISDGDIETHNNIAESTIRKCIRQRDNMLFLYSELGFEAYSKLMTLMYICDMLKINKYHYLQWLIDCIKIEMHEKMFNTKDRGTAKNNFYLPHVQKDEKGNKIGFFDERYKCVYDELSWWKYTPFRYSHRLDHELEIYEKLLAQKTHTTVNSS